MEVRRLKNILLAVGTGYIGTHTCVVLLEAGHSVIVAIVYTIVRLNLWKK